MSEWLGCEAIVRQRERESHAAALAKCSSGASLDSHLHRMLHRDSTISNEVTDRWPGSLPVGGGPSLGTSLPLALFWGGVEGGTSESDLGSKPAQSFLPAHFLGARFLRTYSGNGGGVGTPLRRQCVSRFQCSVCPPYIQLMFSVSLLCASTFKNAQNVLVAKADLCSRTDFS